MARALRLSVVLLLLALFGLRCEASIPPKQTRLWGSGACTSMDVVAAETCEEGRTNVIVGGCAVTDSGTSAVCQVTFTGPRAGNGVSDGPYNEVINAGPPQSVCPDHSSANGTGTCDCSSGYSESGSTCVPRCGSGGGVNPSLGQGSYSVTGNLNNLCAPDGCVVSGAITAHDGGGQFAIGPFTNTGQTCAGATAGGNTPATPTQAPGQSTCTGADMCGGTFNGQFICAKCGDATQQGSPTTTSTTSTSPSGDTTTTTTTSTTSTTDNPNGTSTTTTTTVHGDGSSTSTSSTCKTGAKDCPSALDDNQKDSFGGSCGAAFTCDGDAVQCAIAKEQHQRDCQLFDPASGSGLWADGANKLSTAISDGIAPTWSPAHPSNVVTTNFDWTTTIDRSSTISSSCPADVSVGSTGLVVSLSALCPYLGTLGNFLIAFTSIVCALILFKGLK